MTSMTSLARGSGRWPPLRLQLRLWLLVAARVGTLAPQVQTLRPESLLLVSTLDGSLHALSKQTGDVRWTLKDEPIIQGPMYVTETAFLPDPADGSLYILGTQQQQGLMKLPFTIPELVHASPCRSSDGVFYTGQKQDAWFAVDPESGEKQRTVTIDGPAAAHLYIGRTQYTVTMHDPRTPGLHWNATYRCFSAPPMDSSPGKYMGYLASCGMGLLLTVDPGSGAVLWTQDLGVPVTGVYTWHQDSLRQLSHLTLARDTLHVLALRWGHIRLPASGPRDTTTHFSVLDIQLLMTLYVGKDDAGFYVSKALVHTGVALVPRGLTLASTDGPTTNDVTLQVSGEREGSPSTAVRYPVGSVALPNQWLLIGHHEPPPVLHTTMLRAHPSPGSGHAETRPSKSMQIPALLLELLSLSREEPWDLELNSEEKTPALYPGLGPQDLLAASLTAVLLGGWILFLMRQVSPPSQPRDCLRVSQGELCPPPQDHPAAVSLTQLRLCPRLPPSSFMRPAPGTVPCMLASVSARAWPHGCWARRGAGPGRAQPSKAPLSAAAAAAAGREAAAGLPGTCRSSSRLRGRSPPALRDHPPGPEEAAEPL